MIAIFSERLRKGLKPIIYGDGNQTRDFIHVSDVVNANLLALQTRKGIGEAFNIGTGQSATINKLLRLLIDSMGKPKISATYTQLRTGDIRHSCADIAKARNSLGFKPKVVIAEGLKLLRAYPRLS